MRCDLIEGFYLVAIIKKIFERSFLLSVGAHSYDTQQRDDYHPFLHHPLHLLSYFSSTRYVHQLKTLKHRFDISHNLAIQCHNSRYIPVFERLSTIFDENVLRIFTWIKGISKDIA